MRELTEEDKKYWNMVNPKTGQRYDIPMLKPTDPDYVEKYIMFMRMKENDPHNFEKVLNWD